MFANPPFLLLDAGLRGTLEYRGFPFAIPFVFFGCGHIFPARKPPYIALLQPHHSPLGCFRLFDQLRQVSGLFRRYGLANWPMADGMPIRIG
jgi:hypothetical protein